MCVCVVVQEFPYLGSIIESSGKMDVDVDRRIAQTSKAFGALRISVFLDKNLSLCTKRKVYYVVTCLCCYMVQNAGPLSAKHEKKINTFHHRCIRIILGITNRQQWTERITMKELRWRWGNE